MAIGAMTGAIGWGPQTAKGTEAIAAAIHWHKVREANLQPVSQNKNFAPEVGGSLLPSGAFKAGVWVAGDLDLYPRIGKGLGYLLKAFAGSSKETGAGAPYTHQFPDSGIDVNPGLWLTFRRIVPSTVASAWLGESFKDCRVTSIAISATPGNPLGMKVGILGLTSSPTDVDRAGTPVAGWNPDRVGPPTADNGGYEDYTFCPMTTNVDISGLPAGMDKLRDLQINLTLGTEDPSKEIIVGSISPDDLTPLARSISVSAVVNFKDSALYKSFNYTGTSLSKIVFVSALNVVFKTPSQLYPTGAPTTEGALGFQATNVIWTAEPIGLRGGETVVMRLTGQVIDSATLDYALSLVNGTATYTF